MFQISKTFDFCASHVLEGLPEGHQCGRLHGHNYTIKVVLESEKLDERGFVVDYGDLWPVKQFIDTRLEHRHLNDVLPGMNPTAENIAGQLFWAFKEETWGRFLKEIHVSETPKTWAIYRP